MKKLKLNEVKPMIEFTNGKIFSVKFEKLDGSLRHMICRKGVKSYLRGGVSTTSNNSDIITVFDIKIKQYRKININKVQELKISGETYYLE